MKLLSTFTLAALLSAGAAFAATTPTATPAASATPAAASSSTAKHNSASHCEKEAKSKKLTGDDEKKFVKECKEGKAAS